MPRFTEKDKQRIYVIRSTIEESRHGTWADCERIFNHHSNQRRAQDSLMKVYRELNKADMLRVTCTEEWNVLREEIRQWLHEVSQ